ncbi:MAG: peptidase S41, partial [Bdellovibrio sp.]
TVARYYTPSGRSIQAEGIQPDVEVDSLDPKVFAKAKKHRRVRREKDMRGHLLGEKEKQKQKKKKTFNFWWLSSSKAKEKLSKRDKLLNEDFQVLQAYNYLKAWKVMKNFDRMRQ